MAKTLYAWSNIHHAPEEPDETAPRRVRVGLVPDIKVGDKVTPGDVGYDEDHPDWQYWLEAGVLREYPPPEQGDFPGSPVEFRKAQLSAAMESERDFFDTQFGRVVAEGPPEFNPETGEPFLSKEQAEQYAKEQKTAQSEEEKATKQQSTSLKPPAGTK